MDNKEIRRITHYTFADQRSQKDSWYSYAVSFHEGANVLGQRKDSIHGGMRVFLTNAALSIELLLKAIIVAKGEIAPTTHRLPELARDAGVAFAKDQETTLELLGEVLTWRGRYPVPTKEKTWDDYYDVVQEKHIIRERQGDTARVRTNPETFPSVKNYEVIWSLANRRWDEIQPRKATAAGDLSTPIGSSDVPNSAEDDQN